MVESKSSALIVLLNRSKYSTLHGSYTIFCMALVRDGLWSIVPGTETEPKLKIHVNLEKRMLNIVQSSWLSETAHWLQSYLQ